MSPRQLPIANAKKGAPLRDLLSAAGIRLEGASALGSLSELDLLRRNREEAAAAMLAQLSSRSAELDQTRLEQSEFDRRLTLALRALDEAGRHPDPEVRGALGVFAQRSLVEAPGPIPKLEALELLTRLTAVDYAVLDVAISAGVLLYDPEPTARLVMGDPLPGSEEKHEEPDLPPNVKRPEELVRVLSTHFTDLNAERVRQASQRLRRLGLFHTEHVYGSPSAAGREVLRLSRVAPT